MKEKINFRIEAKTLYIIEEHAKLLGIKKTALIRQIVENYVSSMNLIKGVK